MGEDMECDAEDQAEQDADRVRTISDPGQPSKREREELEATHAQYRSWCIACVRGRGVAMKHFRNTSADEERLHTFVMGLLLSVARKPARNHSASYQGNENKGSWCVRGPVKRTQ